MRPFYAYMLNVAESSDDDVSNVDGSTNISAHVKFLRSIPTINVVITAYRFMTQLQNACSRVAQNSSLSNQQPTGPLLR